MSALETYLQAADNTRGTYHQAAIRNLRTYMKMVPENDIIAAIHRIRNQRWLRLLWEAGLSATLQDIAVRQAKAIEEGKL